MEQVKNLNEERQREAPFSVLHAFSSVESGTAGDNLDYFVSAYRALISITGEKAQEEALEPGSSNPRSRAFARDYLDDAATSNAGLKMRKRILDGSRTHLEKKFLDDVEDVLKKNPSEALVGGVPSLLNKIRGFVRVKVVFKELGVDQDVLQNPFG